MNKNIKRMIAFALAIGTVSVAAPATNYNFLTTKVYASNDDAHDVDSLTLVDRSGNSLKLYTSTSYTTGASARLDVGDTYYTTTTTASVRITSVSGPDDDKVRIFRGNDTDSDDDYEIGDSISLTDDTTILKVRVYKRNYDDDKKYSSSNYNQYLIKVKYTGNDQDLDHHHNHHDHDDDANDDDYLDSLYLYNKNRNEIQLYEDSKYDDKLDNDDLDDDNEGDTYYAKTSSDVVSIETGGVDDDYVRVFKSTNDSSEAIETGDDISVTGDKTLTVRIYDEEPDDDIEYEEDDDVIGEYKIKLEYTGNNGSTSTNTSGTTVSTVNPNQWVQVNGYWQYNDVLGNPLKSQWYYDGNYGKWYYLGSDGIMAVNCWVASGSMWYYVGASGAMLTNSWILTGGKYYYVGSDGAMVTNTTISGYKIGLDGAWIQ